MKKTLLAALAWVLLVGIPIILPLTSAHATVETFSAETEMRQYVASSGLEGYALFNGSSDPTAYSASPTGVAYLVDRQGYLIHTWTGVSYCPRLLENGDLWSVGQIRSWEGTLKWQYTAPANYNIHHEGLRIWNNKVNAFTYLFLFSRTATRAEITAAGGDPSQTGDLTGMDGIIEVNNAKEIIWEWRFLDHVNQSQNSSWPNYVTSPIDDRGRCNLFYKTNHQIRNASGGGPGIALDWHHATSIDYNETKDQIVINSRNWSEVYVIGHGNTYVGTTGAAADYAANRTAAAGTAGNFLWRYGNGAAFGLSTSTTPSWTPPAFKQANSQSLFAPDQASWVGNAWNLPHPADAWTAPAALPPRGTANNIHILVFDTGQYYPTGSDSMIKELNPSTNATDDYVANPASAMLTSVYNPGGNQNDFFNPGVGSVQRLSNSGTFYCSGLHGHLVQMASGGTTPQWEYIIPVVGKNVLPVRTDAIDGTNATPARARFYETNFPGLAGKDLSGGTTPRTITGNPLRNLAGVSTDIGFSCGSCSGSCAACVACPEPLGRTCCTTTENCAEHCAAAHPVDCTTVGGACCPGANSTTCSGQCQSCAERCGGCTDVPTAGQCSTYCNTNHPVDCDTIDGCCALNYALCAACPTCTDTAANGGCGCTGTTCEALNCTCPTCASPTAGGGCGCNPVTCDNITGCPVATTCEQECGCKTPTCSTTGSDSTLACCQTFVCDDCCADPSCGTFNCQSSCCPTCPSYQCPVGATDCCVECRQSACCPACPILSCGETGSSTGGTTLTNGFAPAGGTNPAPVVPSEVGSGAVGSGAGWTTSTGGSSPAAPGTGKPARSNGW